jgi:hypothetical protein
MGVFCKVGAPSNLQDVGRRPLTPPASGRRSTYTTPMFG